jgi:hypothetical protein
MEKLRPASSRPREAAEGTQEMRARKVTVCHYGLLSVSRYEVEHRRLATGGFLTLPFVNQEVHRQVER